MVLGHLKRCGRFLTVPFSFSASKRVPGSRSTRLGPFDAVIDLAMAGFNGLFAGTKLGRPVYHPIVRINDPAPKARLDLLNVVPNPSMKHLQTPRAYRDRSGPRNDDQPFRQVLRPPAQTA